MIDESTEESASLYAFDLLEGAELAAFELQLASDAELKARVRDLREAATSLAFTAPGAIPSPALKSRLLDKIGGSSARSVASNSNLLPFVLPSWIPWAAAACFAIGGIWMGKNYSAERELNISLRLESRLTQITLEDAQNQLKSERIVLNQQIADTTKQLADANVRANDATQRVAALDQQLKTQVDLTAGAENRLKVQREQFVQQLAAANSQSAEATRRVAALNDQLKSEGDLAQFKISTLSSMLNNSPQAQAVAVWNPAKQQGIFTVAKLPAADPSHDYELWVIEKNKKPVSGGVFSIGPDGEARVEFKTEAPVSDIAQFAVSREKKGGAPHLGGPQGDVIMASK